MSFKKCKVVMLPTNEKVWRGQFGAEDGELWTNRKNEIVLNDIRQHLYFLSDEEIKEGDWFLVNGCIIRQCKSTNKEQHTIPTIIDTTGGIHHVSVCKKIIATTDKSIQALKFRGTKIEDFSKILKGIKAQPSQSFIEKYVEEYNKGNVITEVMVEYEGGCENYRKGDCEVPCDNPFCRELLKINPKDNTITIRKVKSTYSREEVEALLHKATLQAMEEQDEFDFWKFVEENL